MKSNNSYSPYHFLALNQLPNVTEFPSYMCIAQLHNKISILSEDGEDLCILLS